jgi:transcriptional regulator GlxA family with amidase domain
MLAYPDAQVLDVTGPLEVFGRAARWIRDHGLSRELAYRVEIVAPRAGAFATSSGLRLLPNAPTAACAAPTPCSSPAGSVTQTPRQTLRC